MIPRPSAQTRPPSGVSEVDNNGVHKSHTVGGSGMRALQIPESSSTVVESGHVSTPDSSKEEGVKGRRLTMHTVGPRDANADALPFPPRPGLNNISRLVQLQQEVQNKHQQSRRKAMGISGTVTFDLAGEGRRYPGETPADFSPWTGTESSEHLTPMLIKQGLQSTSIITHEQHTARPTLWPSLRNKGSGGGRSTLAALLCSVLERRQQFGKLTAPSTFKPPPRVALTDKSRETWLLELANPQVPLKKLSRRIPHGIRGKGLLDECMNKKIPPARAVWLSKCVGAQEMRAFKRKGAGSSSVSVGVGGETKWIKEWTLHVQQFVESVIAACGTHRWRDKIEYAIRLTTTLYAENLLDNDQYLEWILTSLEESGTDKLPLWLMLSQIYFRDFILLRRRGRRLTEAIIQRMASLEAENELEICKPLYQKLRHLLATLLVDHRACFIAPKQWKLCRQVLVSLMAEEGARQPTVAAAAKNVIERNDSLFRCALSSGTTLGTGQKRLVHALDSAFMPANVLNFRFEQLWEQCLEVKLPEVSSIETTIRWACSYYRSGEADIFLVARLIRAWKSHGHDADESILSFLKTAATERAPNIDEPRLFRTIAELCRTKSFSIGKYLQWLISVGAMRPKVDLIDSLHRRLLLQLPMHGLPSHLINLRDLLLSGAESDRDDEAERTDAYHKMMHHLSYSKSSDAMREVSSNLRNETLSAQTKLARWLRQEVASCLQMKSEKANKSSPSDNYFEDKVSNLSLSQYQTTCYVLEEIGDLCILADVIGLSMFSEDTSVLAACAITLDLHADTFAAIGALGPLFIRLTERYALMRSVQPLDRNFVLNLFDLASKRGASERLCQSLKLDLSRCEHHTAVQMCSPASDGMGDMVGNSRDGSLAIEEEIERALNSGNSMDEGAARRTFTKIVEVVTKVASQSGLRNDRIMDTKEETRLLPPLENWLQKLKAFDERVFEKLAGEWLTGIISEQTPGQSELLSFSVSTLVGAGTLNLQSFMTGATKMLGTLMKIAPKQVAGPALNLLTLLVPGLPRHAMVEEQHWYRFRVERRSLQSLALDLLQPLFVSVARSPNAVHGQYLTSLLKSSGLLTIVRQQAVQNVEFTATSLGLGVENHTSGPTQKQAQDVDFEEMLLDELVDPQNVLKLAELSKEEQIRQIISIADDFSLPFCQLKIRSLLNTPTMASTTSADAMVIDDDRVEMALLDALKATICQSSNSLADLVGGFGNKLSQRIRHFVEQQILSAVNDVAQKLDDSDRDKSDANALQRYISVVDASIHGELPSTESPQLLPSVTEKLKSLCAVLDSWQDSEQSSWRPPRVQQACVWIYALLHLCISHQEALISTSSSDQIALCTVLCSLMLHPLLVFSAETTETIADFVALLSDNFNAEMHLHMARLEAQHQSGNKSMTFFFGSCHSPESWLGLLTSTGSTSTSAPTSTPKASGTVASPSTPISPAPAQAAMTSPQQVVPQVQRQASGPQRAPGNLNAVAPKSGTLQQAQMARMGQRQGGANQPPQQVQARQAQQTWPPAQQQRRPSQSVQAQSYSTAQGALNNSPLQTQKQQVKEKVSFNPPIPFPLRTWEILPDASGTGVGTTTSKFDRDVNDTAISLQLFGARRVI